MPLCVYVCHHSPLKRVEVQNRPFNPIEVQQRYKHLRNKQLLTQNKPILVSIKKPCIRGLYLGLVVVWRLVALCRLLSDTKLRKDIVQQIIGIHFSYYFSKVKKSFTKVHSK